MLKKMRQALGTYKKNIIKLEGEHNLPEDAPVVCFHLMDFVAFQVMYQSITNKYSSLINRMGEIQDGNPDLPLSKIMGKVINEDPEVGAEYKKILNEILGKRE